MSAVSQERSLTLTDIAGLHGRGEKIVMLTCYDASFAAACGAGNVELILIGDSLGMVVQGHGTTLPVTMEQVVYHTEAVARAKARPLLIGDMPFGSYHASPQVAYENAARLLAAGAQMVKLEGGAVIAPTVRFLTEREIPVCAHVGLIPQSIHRLGGFKVQGRSEDAARTIEDDAVALEEAGASLLVLEAIPSSVAARVTQRVKIPTIGIGAGPDCSGQVLVLYDMLGIYPGKRPRFVRNFMDGSASIVEAIQAYSRSVKDGSFPAPEHCFT